VVWFRSINEVKKMREYIPKSKSIRPEVWKRITSVIKDYKQLTAEYKAIRSLNENERNRLRENEVSRKIFAFDYVWSNTDEETRQLIELKFMKGKTYRDMWLPMSESTMKRMVKKFVRELGRQLGEID